MDTYRQMHAMGALDEKTMKEIERDFEDMQGERITEDEFWHRRTFGRGKGGNKSKATATQRKARRKAQRAARRAQRA